MALLVGFGIAAMLFGHLHFLLLAEGTLIAPAQPLFAGEELFVAARQLLWVLHPIFYICAYSHMYIYN